MRRDMTEWKKERHNSRLIIFESLVLSQTQNHNKHPSKKKKIRKIRIRPLPHVHNSLQISVPSPHAVHVIPAPKSSEYFLDACRTRIEISLVAQFCSFHQSCFCFQPANHTTPYPLDQGHRSLDQMPPLAYFGGPIHRLQFYGRSVLQLVKIIGSL